MMMIALAVLTTPAVAQDNTTTDGAVDEFQEDNCPEPEAINDNLVLCSADYDDGTATLRFKADNMTRVVLTDSGAFMRGGDVPQRRVLLRGGGEVNTVTWDVVEYEGNAGVAVDHADGLYSVPLEDPFVFVGGPWGASDAQLAALSAALSVGGVSIFVVLRGVLGRDQEPERVA